MKFSIIVLTYNSEKTLPACLGSLMVIDYPKNDFEVIVIDGGSKDRTLDIANEYDLRVLRQHGNGFSNARNTGIQNASYDFIVFCDSDCEVSKSWLRELSWSLKDGYVAVGGPCLCPDTNHFGRIVSALGYPAGGIKRAMKPSSITKDISTCNMVFKKELTDRIGMFDEQFKYGGEDTDFVKRLSSCGDVYFNSKAIVYHKPRESFRDFAAWWHRRGRADIMLHKKYLPNYPFSLFSPKVSYLEQLTVIVLLLGLSYMSGFLKETFFIFVLVFAFYLLSYQHNLDDLKMPLSLSTIDCLLYIPVLAYMMCVFRDIGRIMEYFSYEGRDSIQLLLKSIVSRFSG